MDKDEVAMTVVASVVYFMVGCLILMLIIL